MTNNPDITETKTQYASCAAMVDRLLDFLDKDLEEDPFTILSALLAITGALAQDSQASPMLCIQAFLHSYHSRPRIADDNEDQHRPP